MQNNKLKVFVIAGEVSGDVLGAKIMHQMNKADFIGVGGENMQAAGLTSLFPMADLAVMGAIEVLGRAKTLTRRINQTVQAIYDNRPDVILTIDSPGFAKAVISKVRKSDAGKKLIANGLCFHHVVAPQVWAWRPKRAKKYAKIFDKLYSFFEFEVPYFTKYGLDVMPVGHPIADNLICNRPKKLNKNSHEKIITLVPGSRMSEVKKLLPLFQDVAQRLDAGGYRDYKFVIPTVETTAEYVGAQTKLWNTSVELVPADARYELYAKSYIAIVASGTVSAELAMMHIPTIVVYKMNAITTWLIRRFIQVRWVSLVNILLNRGVYPEFLGTDAETENVLDAVQQLSIPSVREKMIKTLQSADSLWCLDNQSASSLIAADLYKLIR